MRKMYYVLQILVVHESLGSCKNENLNRKSVLLLDFEINNNSNIFLTNSVYIIFIVGNMPHFAYSCEIFLRLHSK